MAWVVITREMVQSRLSFSEEETMTGTGGRSQEIDQLDMIIQQVTGQVRGKVAACKDNHPKMGPAGTIPNELLFHAIALIRAGFDAASAATTTFTSARQAEVERAYTALDQAAACEITIEDANGVIPEAVDPTGGILYGGDPVEIW